MSDTLLQVVFSSLPFAVVLFLVIAAVLGIGLGLVWPRLLAYPYLCIFFWMNSTSYGSLSVFATPGVYSRGSGLLFFPVVLWYVLGAWACARVAAAFRPGGTTDCNLRPWFWGWTLLLGAHAAAAIFAGVPLKDALAPSGFSNIVWMGPLVALMLLAFRTRAEALELARFIMLAGLGRALFGLVRWAAFGGDPNNVYANMNAISIRLTFFDINDSLLCMMACAIAAVTLFGTGNSNEKSDDGQTRLWRLLAWLALASTAACIVLSYRRSAWIGFMLGCAVVLLRFPPRRRIQLALAASPLVGAALGYAALRRLGQAGGGMASLLYDMQSRRFGPESERVLELKLVLADILARPFTGIGAWGRYTGYQQISWQANPDGGLFLHSGVLHVLLKSGLPGLILLGGTICAFVLVARRALRSLPPDLLGLGTAGAAALAFMIPDVLIGTPFPGAHDPDAGHCPGLALHCAGRRRYHAATTPEAHARTLASRSRIPRREHRLRPAFHRVKGGPIGLSGRQRVRAGRRAATRHGSWAGAQSTDGARAYASVPANP
ncbi:O-antigen ligase family protein [Massilia sp. Dwa41.01b]|uniref:O-antigen ligase family protein n=1 Tax=Massilia sp. Dwa41.01b TaxID=2709302 RepID=UPI001E438B09|nr:O-antigen ligase family protein [Massilia sp. Dwa41.01b]